MGMGISLVNKKCPRPFREAGIGFDEIEFGGEKRTASKTVRISGLLSQRVLLTDDRQNPGCRYSRDRNGSWVGPMKAVPSCNVVSFLPTQDVAN